MRVFHRGTEDDRVIGGVPRVTLPERLTRSLRHRWQTYARRECRTGYPAYFPFDYAPTSLSEELNRSPCDVLHLHWMADMLSIGDIARLTKPIVWTLHDTWAFCGGEICAEDHPEARFRQGYRADNRRPGEPGPDLNRLVWEAKFEAWAGRRFSIVSPSRWLARCAQESVLFGHMPVHVVPNPLDVNGVWQHIPAEAARIALRLPPHKKLILMGADGGLAELHKGGDLLLASVAQLALQSLEVELVIFGQAKPAGDQNWPCPIHWLGTVRDDRVLALAYSAADVMVVPSRQDNLPCTAVEAQACGTPVVAFDVGGLPDIVGHRETGWLARPFDTADMAAGIRWVLEDAERRTRLSRAARATAVARYSPGVVAAQYVQIYEEALANAPDALSNGD